ncbi:MAG: Dam family site-specific DNA-(adenine-N6)-methyltransferase [Chamaesiphon sp. CSU_1_12]|nr:Dam family site-specific DNA-(adenine-N6)-methyltransferase [Chamaesiphon sp. CSU_1_12]
MTAKIKPIVKWAGNKTWLVPRMRELYAPYRHRRWIDPFCGSLALPLALMPTNAFLSDINCHLIELYQQVKYNDTFSSLELGNTEKEYYQIRRDFNYLIESKSSDREILAQFFYYLNHAGFNGLCRYNRDGKFNVPYGKRSKLSHIKDFKSYRECFLNWAI